MSTENHMSVDLHFEKESHAHENPGKDVLQIQIYIEKQASLNSSKSISFWKFAKMLL